MNPHAPPERGALLLGGRAGSLAAMTRQDAIALFLSRTADQTRLGAPWGNCLEACYAALLGVPLAAVPDPRNRARSPREAYSLIPARIPAISAWLARQGYARISGSPTQGGPGDRRPDGLPLFWIASGPSERGLQHATVYADNHLVFDPHPSKAGLLSVNLWTVVVPLGPLWARC